MLSLYSYSFPVIFEGMGALLIDYVSGSVFKRDTIRNFRVPKTLTFKTKLSANPFLWK